MFCAYRAHAVFMNFVFRMFVVCKDHMQASIVSNLEDLKLAVIVAAFIPFMVVMVKVVLL